MDPSRKSKDLSRTVHRKRRIAFVGSILFLGLFGLYQVHIKNLKSTNIEISQNKPKVETNRKGSARLPSSNSDKEVDTKPIDLDQTNSIQKSENPNQYTKEEIEEFRRTKKLYEECDAKLEIQSQGKIEFLKRHRQKLDQKFGLWIYDFKKSAGIPENEVTIESKFLLALVYAGMLTGLDSDPNLPNFDKATELFSEVMKLAPGNSAPLLFYAAVLKKQGKLQQAKEIKSKAFQTSYFDAYENTVGKALIDLIETTSDVYIASLYLSSSPIPDLSFLKELFTEPEDYFFADQMLVQSLNPDNLLEDYHWSIYRHQFAKAMWKKTTGKDDILGFKELVKVKYSSRGLEPPDYENGPMEFLKSCDLSYYEEGLALWKSHRNQK